MEGIKFPANAMLINKAFIEIANFEVIPSGEINDQLFYFPEVDPYSLNFEECGIDSLFFLPLMGLPLYIMLVHIALSIVYLVLALINHFLRLRCLDKILMKMKSYLFWNGFLRLYMEIYQGLCVATVLNTYTAEDDVNSQFIWV